jgi:hypothetical protein
MAIACTAGLCADADFAEQPKIGRAMSDQRGGARFASR